MSEFLADEAATAAALTLPYDFAPASPPEGDPVPAPETPAAAPAEPEPETIPEFDPAHRQAFTGMLYVGALTDEIRLYGHTFTLATPTQTERLQIGQVIAPYANTVTGELAYATALVAASLTKVDGQPLPQPILNNPKESALADRFAWVSENLRRPVINSLFERCLELDNKVDEVLAAMGKASG